jgi:hypothetical protein
MTNEEMENRIRVGFVENKPEHRGKRDMQGVLAG